MKLLQFQCKKQSRKVEKKDYPRIEKIANELIDLCRQPLGKYPNAITLAHCQVDHNDPLRFFVTFDGRVIINPKITGHSFKQTNKKEGCYSFPHRHEKKIKRWDKVYIDYQVLCFDGDIINKHNVPFADDWASVFQHELDHFNSKSIY